jgi:hypothetical protein
VFFVSVQKLRNYIGKDKKSKKGKDKKEVLGIKNVGLICIDEFHEYCFRDDRVVGDDGDSDDDDDDSDSDNDNNESNNKEDYPSDVNEQTSMLFSLKEVKSLLAFSQQVTSNPALNPDNDDYSNIASNRDDIELHVKWLWGGKPIKFSFMYCNDKDGDNDGDDDDDVMWSAELTMATRPKPEQEIPLQENNGRGGGQGGQGGAADEADL